MRIFILRLIIFLLPLAGWFFAEGLFPANSFTYRPFEALEFQTRFALNRNFYPNSVLKMESVGELCHHTKYAIPKKEYWITDKLGNRNNNFIEDPDILILGDSNIFGSSIDQDSTITNQLSAMLKNQFKVYNIAPGDFSTLDYYLKANLIKKPKYIIYSRGERYFPGKLNKYPKEELQKTKTQIKFECKDITFFNKLTILMDKILRLYSLNWLEARIQKKVGEGVPGTKKSRMFFLDESNIPPAPYLVGAIDDVEKTKDIIVSYKNYCDSLGIKFLYLPVPSKGTVYYDYIPIEKQPDTYLQRLDTLLNLNNIQTINTLELFNDYRKSHNKLLYHLDDTHWNANGVNVASQEIVRRINQDKNFLVSKN